MIVYLLVEKNSSDKSLTNYSHQYRDVAMNRRGLDLSRRVLFDQHHRHHHDCL
jgi:hypothetical protein